MNLKSASFGLIVGALAVSAVSYADLGTPDGVMIPYAGTLQRDGQPLDGPVDLIFDVFTSASSASCHTTGATSTDVVAGQFTVRVGPVPEACVQGRQVHLGISVDDGNSVVALPGRQRVFPSLSAMTSGTGAFATAEGIRGGNAAGNLHIDANAVDTGPDASIYLNYYSGSAVKFGNGGESVVATVDNAGNLTTNGTVNDLEMGEMGFGDRFDGIASPGLNTQTQYGFLVGDQGNSFMNASGSGANHLRYQNSDILVAGNTRIEMQRDLVVNGEISSQCRSGFTPINGGRLCMGGVNGPHAMQSAATNAITVCKNVGAHVCLHSEVHEACGAGFDVFSGVGGNSFWFGDATGDNAFIFSSGGFNTCSASDTSANANGISGSARYRCCY